MLEFADSGVDALDTNLPGKNHGRPGAARKCPVAVQAVVADAPARRLSRILGVRGCVVDGQEEAGNSTHTVDHHEIRRFGRESDAAGGERVDTAGRQRGRVREGAQAGARRAAAVRMDADGECRCVFVTGQHIEFDAGQRVAGALGTRGECLRHVEGDERTVRSGGPPHVAHQDLRLRRQRRV